MNPQLSNVRDFMKAFGQEVHDKPFVNAPYELRLLRARLILEEALETVSALGFSTIGAKDYDTYEKDYEKFHGCKPRISSLEHENADGEFSEFVLVDDTDFDLEAVLDGLVDLDYVGHKGTALALGLSSCLEDADKEVHRSNMSKLWSEEEVYALGETAVEFVITPIETITDEIMPNLYLVTLNGKVIKPPSYSRANLTPILNKASA